MHTHIAKIKDCQAISYAIICSEFQLFFSLKASELSSYALANFILFSINYNYVNGVNKYKDKVLKYKA